MQYFVGIDNSSLDHKVQILDDQGNQKVSFTVANTFEGFQKLTTMLADFDDIKIGFELPHGPLVDYLHSLNYTLYSLNPLKIKRYKESTKVSGNKNDAIDAHAIADYIRTNTHYTKELLYHSSEIERLKMLSIMHTRLTHDRTRHVNKLHYAVSQYFPLQESLFVDFACTVHLKMIIQYPTCSDLKAASADEIRTFLRNNKYGKAVYSERIIEKIKTYQQHSSPDVEWAYQMEARCLCAIIQTLNDTLHHIEKQMNAIVDSHQLGKYFQSLPGAGTILSCKLLALFGDNKHRFDNYNSVQCLFGTAPKNYQSGIYHKVIMRKACNKSARAVLYQFAFSSLQFSQWAREYYDMQRKKGKTHSVAIRALSNKWVKIMYKIWKEEIFYEENKKISAVA